MGLYIIYGYSYLNPRFCSGEYFEGGIFQKNSAKISRIAKNERFTSVSPQ